MNAAVTVTQKQLADFLLNVALVRPVFIWGPPGIGKSALVQQFAAQLGLPCVSLLGSQLAPEDLIGVPQIVDGTSRFCPPRMIARAEPYCLFLLEWAGANGIHPLVLDYIGARPDHLWSQPPKHEEPFSTPRAWHMLSDALHAHGEAIADGRLEVLAFGCLSPAHAGQFKAAENFAIGVALVRLHPIFAPLLYHVSLVRQEGNLCPADGWAVITRGGALHAHPTRRGEPAEWAAAHDEMRVYQQLRETGLPAGCGALGAGGPHSGDLVWGPERTVGPQQPFDWAACFAQGLGREIYINPAAGLDALEYRFVMAHELLHVGLRHATRAQGRDAELWNIAADFVVNAWLVEMGVGKLPSMGLLYDPALKGESAESVYDRLAADLRRFGRLATLRGSRGGDMLEPRSPDWWGSPGGSDLDDFYRRALSQGLLWHQEQGRGFLPAGLVEEIRALSLPPIPWDVALARWPGYLRFDGHAAARPSAGGDRQLQPGARCAGRPRGVLRRRALRPGLPGRVL